MATTDGEFLAGILDRLHSVCSVAFLHAESAAAAGELRSDADLVVPMPARDCMKQMRRSLDNYARLVLTFPYDTGAESYFFLGPEDQGAQVDLMHDPMGRGRLGLRSDALLQSAVAGDRWPRLAHLDLQIYTFLKRTMKGDHHKARQALESLRAEETKCRARLDEVCVARTGAMVRAALDTSSVVQFDGPGPDLRRLASRVLRPVGRSISFTGSGSEEAADALRARLAPLVPNLVRSHGSPGLAATLAELARCIRPAVTVSAEPRPGMPWRVWRQHLPAQPDGLERGLAYLEDRAWRSLGSY